MARRPGARILITRSQPGAAVLAQALASAGFVPLQHPVLAIRPQDPPESADIVARLDQFDVVMFLSQHAVAFGMPLIATAWPRLPSQITWIAVGDATAAALTERGVAAVVPDSQNSEGILALLDARGVLMRRALIVAGAGGRMELALGLIQRGATVERLEVYRREPISREAAVALAPLVDGIDAAVIASADGVRAFAMVWQDAGGSFDLPLLVPSARVARTAEALQFTKVIECAGAGSDAVVRAIQTTMGTNNE